MTLNQTEEELKKEIEEVTEKMKDKFVLSEKGIILEYCPQCKLSLGFDGFPKEDVKEFIKRLKEIMDEEADFCKKGNILPSIHPRRVKEWIDKLAGEKLK